MYEQSWRYRLIEEMLLRPDNRARPADANIPESLCRREVEVLDQIARDQGTSAAKARLAVHSNDSSCTAREGNGAYSAEYASTDVRSRQSRESGERWPHWVCRRRQNRARSD